MTKVQHLCRGCQLELHHKISADAGKSPTLARRDAPLATGVTNISPVNPLRDREINYRLIIYSHSSTQPENLVKLGHDPVDIQIFVLAEIVKTNEKNETEAEHIARRLLSAAG